MEHGLWTSNTFCTALVVWHNAYAWVKLCSNFETLMTTSVPWRSEERIMVGHLMLVRHLYREMERFWPGGNEGGVACVRQEISRL